jgi:transcriptional regulator with XRE-family HTH domain
MKRHHQISEFEQGVIDLITDYRKTNNITQQTYADILHVSRAFIAEVENITKSSKYNLDHVNAFSDYFGVSPHFFIPEKAIPV